VATRFYFPKIRLLPFAIAVLICGGIYGRSIAANFPAPTQLELKDELGRGVQRTMKRLEESSPEHKNTVRILFYGQSITEQAWSKAVADNLRQRYPNANLVIENRAIGGFASDLLVQISEADLYPFYPDLLIFYDYGRNDCYEEMIRRTRERTTAEIVLQTDHPTSMNDLQEEIDPAKLVMSHWSSWFPNFWIPTMAVKYHTGMVQQRALWKIYCQTHHLDPRSLTMDGTHLNDQGNFLMAALMEACLVRRPQYDDPAVEQQIRDYPPEGKTSWSGNKLVLPFTGNKIDVVAAPGATGSAHVLIDGRKPSEFPELYTPTRVSGFPGIGWPILSRIDHQKPQVLEGWAATLTNFSSDGKHFKFSVEGSVTGSDGAGNSDQTFVSNSGRVVIPPEAWNIAYSFGLLQGRAQAHTSPAFVVPDKLVATWETMPLFVDTYSAPVLPDPAVETLVTLAQGLANGTHELQLISDKGPVAFRALRVYRPPLPAVESSAETPVSSDKSLLKMVPTFAPPPAAANQAPSGH
jgi:hypothetical protein